MAGRRLLLVEDDPSLQRFVVLALSEMDLQVQCCAHVDGALAALRAQAFDLILTDLMLPGRSGFELIEALAQDPAQRGDAVLMVFSAGLTPQVRQRLADMGVRRLLSKPCTVGELEAAVRAAIENPPAHDPAPLPASLPAAAADAVASHFGGDRALYDAYRAGCLRQFNADLVEGDQAVAEVDANRLQRLAHNLKSVLLILGHREESLLARQLEEQAQARDWAVAATSWRKLKGQLRALA